MNTPVLQKPLGAGCCILHPPVRSNLHADAKYGEVCLEGGDQTLGLAPSVLPVSYTDNWWGACNTSMYWHLHGATDKPMLLIQPLPERHLDSLSRLQVPHQGCLVQDQLLCPQEVPEGRKCCWQPLESLEHHLC